MARLRLQKGSAISETGPALFILIVMVFFPALNIIQIATAYAVSQTYTDYMVREIACTNPALSADAITKINSDFTGNPLFEFMKVKDFRVSQGPRFLDKDGVVIASIPAATSTTDADNVIRRGIERVRVQTTVTVEPYFTVPFFHAIPGLSAPVDFTETTDRPQEERGLN